ncbi:RHS repeat domain-containing protein [Cellvibrio mixtus]|uniref:RHS repeat domain-containing protein n=1 Tax=Cellvibrio mixtus TaxID=39650 RepID=UPI001F173992|nr:RHS repeat domain-containing protein [Cellvibrio mixtus]
MTISNNLNRRLFDVSWNGVSSVTRYELYRSGALIYSGLAVTQEVPVGNFGVTIPFSIKACNAAGCTSGSSGNGNFPTPPTTAIIQSPAIGTTATIAPVFAATGSSLVSNATYTISLSEAPRAGLNNQYTNYWAIGGLSSTSLTQGSLDQLIWNSGWVQRTRNGNPDGPAVIVSNSSPQFLTVGKTYYWHIVASGSNGGLSKSAEGRFAVVAATSSSRSSSSFSSTSNSSSASIQSVTIIFTYDDLGRVKTVTHPNTIKNTYEYDDANNRTKMESLPY